MTGNPLYCRGLTLSLKSVTTGLLGLIFTVFGTLGPSFAADSADTLSIKSPGAPCWSGDFTTEGDRCLVLEQARGLLSRLVPSTAAHLRKVADGFDLERSLRVQQALFREDLIWQSRGFTNRQIDLMVFLAVSLTVGKTAALETEILRSLEDCPEPEVKRRLERVQRYHRQAVVFLNRVFPTVENMPDYELKFFF